MTVLMIIVFTLASCMGSDNIETTPECAITGFSVSSITSDVKTKKYDQYGHASDTLVSRTIYGSQIFFIIDQLTGDIYTVDSLPNWVDLSKVIANVNAQGNVYYKLQENDELYYPLNSGSTIIDFNKTVELLCESTDKLSKRIYKVDIYKHVGNTDTLEWEAITSDLTITGASKAFHIDGKVFVFAQNDHHQPVVTIAAADDASQWSTPTTIPVDNSSIVLFNHNFYGLGDDGYIYRSNPAQQARIHPGISHAPNHQDAGACRMHTTSMLTMANPSSGHPTSTHGQWTRRLTWTCCQRRPSTPSPILPARTPTCRWW